MLKQNLIGKLCMGLGLISATPVSSAEYGLQEVFLYQPEFAIAKSVPVRAKYVTYVANLVDLLMPVVKNFESAPKTFAVIVAVRPGDKKKDWYEFDSGHLSKS